MKTKLQQAIEALKEHDKLPAGIVKFNDSQSPKWERLLRDLVGEVKGYGN